MTIDETREAPGPERRVAVDFSELALDLHAEPTSESTVQRVSEYAVSALGVDDAGVLLVLGRDRFQTAAATSDLVRRAHDLQVELGEGPCLDTLAGEPSVRVVDDTRLDGTWPRWSPAIAELGYRSTLSVRLATHDRRYGALNLYSRSVRAFDRDDVAVAMIFGRHAAVALAASHDADGLQRAMDARKLIGIAMGILVERYSLEPDAAFDVLRRYSQHHNVKLREVARRVVEDRELPSA